MDSKSHETSTSSRNGFHVRHATALDAPSIRVLFAEHLAALGYEPDPELDNDIADFPESYAPDGCHFIVAEDQDGAVAGMAGLKNGEIRRLFVKGACRRQGLAGLMIAALMKCHRGAGPLTAVVASDNAPARAAFAAMGFVSTGAAPDHPKMRRCEILRFQGTLH